MNSKGIKAIIDRFVSELTEAVEKEASDAVQDRLREVIGASPGDAVPSLVRRRTTKGYSVLRPCPVPGCSGTAAPRHQMVCKEHSKTMSREEIIVARDNAYKPDGVWRDIKLTKKIS